MSYPINYPTPQGANVQIFYAGGNVVGGTTYKTTPKDWVKPQGASFVWFTLIGSGGGGSVGDTLGGGSGAVTNFMGPAFLMPDVLRINVGVGAEGKNTGSPTTVVYQAKNDTGYTLLTAEGGGGGGTGVTAAAMTANYFTAMGFLQSVAGTAVGTITASPTTFLSSGGYEGNTTVVSNYGYTNPATVSGFGTPGYFQMQPIIVGTGGTDGAGGVTQGGQGGIGCGGPANSSGLGGRGGDGMVVIITW